MASSRGQFNFIDNYIYLHHIDTMLVLPVSPENVSDTQKANFNASNPLARSAPIQSYASSGPRTLQLRFQLHRDLMTQVNYNVSNAVLQYGDDYVDYLINALQASVLPSYAASQKMVDPPIISVRIGNDIFCKGVITGGITFTYSPPVLDNNKYALVELAFTMDEITPFSANNVISVGSYRSIDTSLERNTFSNGTIMA